MKNKTKISSYFAEFKRLIDKMEVFDRKRKSIDLELAVNKAIKLISQCRRLKNRVFFVGNGGSASIASHMATDLLKNGKLRALFFGDASLLTCVSNDLGYEEVFARPIEEFAQKNDILFAISSSGRSENILNSVKAARGKGCFIITLSGFDKDNLLSCRGDLNFYVHSHAYSHVEVLHLALCHYLSDVIIEQVK